MVNPLLQRKRSAKSGQAIAEFVIGLVGILILTAAMLQLGTLVREDTRTLENARNDAGQAALSDRYLAPVSPGPRYIQDWSVGPDGNAYTRDDQAVIGNSALLSDGVVVHANPARLAELLPNNQLSPLSDSSQILSGLSFVRGHATSGAVPLYPITRNLIFGRDSITLDTEVYLIWTRGLE